MFDNYIYKNNITLKNFKFQVKLYYYYYYNTIGVHFEAIFTLSFLQGVPLIIIIVNRYGFPNGFPKVIRTNLSWYKNHASNKQIKTYLDVAYDFIKITLSGHVVDILTPEVNLPEWANRSSFNAFLSKVMQETTLKYGKYIPENQTVVPSVHYYNESIDHNEYYEDIYTNNRLDKSKNSMSHMDFYNSW